MEAKSSNIQQTDQNVTHPAEENNLFRHDRTTGFATTSGQTFECKIAALLYLRGLNSGLVFELAVNVAGAGSFDDIVFRFKTREESEEWITCFVQVKHKNNSTLTCSQLIGTSGPFSLPSYVKAYGEVKHSMSDATKHSLFDGKIDNSWFILFTNSKDSDGLGQGRECFRKAEGVEKFLWTNKGKIFSNSEDHEGFAKEINECLKRKGEDGEEFLSRLKLFCGQPNHQHLDSLIIDELRQSKLGSNSASDVLILFRFFIDGIKEWCEAAGKGVVLHKDSNLFEVANEKTLVEVCSFCERVTYQISPKIRYNIDALSELKKSAFEGKNFVHFIPSEPLFKLSCSKVVQAFENEAHFFFGIETLIRYQQQVLKEWKNVKAKSKTLIIVINNSEEIKDEMPLAFFRDVCNDLCDDARIVLLAEKDNSLVDKISKETGGERLSHFEDSFHASQLEKQSLTYISRDISFKLQGYWTKLGNFPDMTNQNVDERQNEATLGLDGCLLVDIVEGGCRYSVGAPLPDGIKYYVSRTMDQFTVLKPSIFNDSSLSESVSIRHATRKYVRSVLAQSATPEQVRESLRNYSQSLLCQDNSNSKVFIGANFTLGRFVCNFIGFQSQYDPDELIPALRVRIGNTKSTDQEPSFKWFLFIFDHCPVFEESLLWEYHGAKHFLRLDNELLKWTNSVGGIKVIRKHVDGAQVIPTVNPETATCVDDRRVVLFCAEPGIGKSTLMTRLAKKTKEAHPNLWVILLSLNDQTHLFAEKIHTDALKFLIDASDMQNESEKRLFKIALETAGNVVVLLDGYDEIAPKYINECCVLLTNLINNTKAHKIWITSRISMKDALEVHLSTLAANLRKFNVDDQRRFLRQYWVDKSTMSESVLETYISNLIKITSQTIRDQEKDFMGIPLQTQIMAEVFEEGVTETAAPDTVSTEQSNKLDLLDLLRKFVDKKINLYYQTKLKLNSTGAGFERHVSSLDTTELYKGHQLASLILILSDDELKELHSKTILDDSRPFFEDIKSSADKTGIIDGVINNKPRFVHRVYAEFFLAQWLVEHLQENATFLKKKLYTPEYAVILNFFDRALVKKHCLHTAVLDANLEEVEKLLSDGVDVHAVDEMGRTALHLAATLGASKIQSLNDGNMKILELLMEKLPEIINRKDAIMFCTPLCYADTSGWWPAVNKLMAVSGRPEDIEQYLVNTKSKIEDGAMLGAIVAEDLVELLYFCLKHGLALEANTLQSAFEHGSSNVALILIDKGADF